MTRSQNCLLQDMEINHLRKGKRLILFLFFIVVISFMAYNYFLKDTVSIEKAIRGTGHTVVEKGSHITAALNSPSAEKQHRYSSPVKHQGYQFDMQRILESSSIQHVDMHAKKTVDAASLKHQIPRFADVPPFWDNPLEFGPTDQPAVPLINSSPYSFKDTPLNKKDIKVLNAQHMSTNDKYAVVSCSPAFHDRDINFAFFLPIDVYMWQKLGYKTIVILVGSEGEWQQRASLQFIVAELLASEAIIVFLDVRDAYRTMTSQVSRLFVPMLLNWTGNEDAYVVLSDADLWPLRHDSYDLPPLKKILVLNSECCPSFSHRGHQYKMLPMCNIGMTVKTWCEVMNFSPGKTLTSLEQMRGYVQHEFGSIASQAVIKGENDGWFLDQHLFSVRLAQWAAKHGSDAIQYVRRDPARDRIDRTSWRPILHPGIIDAHLLEHIHRPSTWEQVMPLLQAVFTEERCQWANKYRDRFLRIIANITQVI